MQDATISPDRFRSFSFFPELPDPLYVSLWFELVVQVTEQLQETVAESRVILQAMMGPALSSAGLSDDVTSAIVSDDFISNVGRLGWRGVHAVVNGGSAVGTVSCC